MHPIDIQEVKVAVDVVAFAYTNNKMHTLLVKRIYAPFADQWAFPGGFFGNDELLEEAAVRMLKRETGIAKEDAGFIMQVGTFGNLDRDPRQRVISTVYALLLKELPAVKGEEDSEAKWWDTAELPTPLAFDHDMIYENSSAKLQELIAYTEHAKWLLPDEFSKEEFRNLYETVLKEKFLESSFERHWNYLMQHQLVVETTHGFKYS